MEISSLGAHAAPSSSYVFAVPQGAETGAHGQAAPAENRSQAVQARVAREVEQEQRNPAPQLLAQQAAAEVTRLAIAQVGIQQAAARDTGETDAETRSSDLKIKAVRAYEETNQVLDEAKSLIDRIVLIPEKGDLSLEASQMPPYGPPPGPGVAEQGVMTSALRAEDTSKSEPTER